jgi:hypothetical protein
MIRLTASILLALSFAAVLNAAPRGLGEAVAASNRQDEPEGDQAAGIIKGTVRKNNRVLKDSLIRVEIVGLGEKFRKKINSDGTFEFADVPAGTYVLKATGSYKNAEIQGELKDVKPAEKEKAEAVAVTVE